MDKTNLIGAITAIAFFVSAILVFVFRLLGKPRIEYWLGIFELLLSIQLIYLLIKAPAEQATAYRFTIFSSARSCSGWSWNCSSTSF